MTKFKGPLVSVVIPVYNVHTFLPRCLESLLNQTFEGFEILCIDDESSDGSADIVRSFEKHDSRIHLLMQNHQGVSAARNFGISQARGKYIIFVDGDDWLEKEMLESMVETAEQTNADMIICSAKVQCERFALKEVRYRNSLQSALTVEDQFLSSLDEKEDIWEVLKRPGYWPFIWNKLIRSDILLRNKIIFPENLALGEDGVFLQVLFQYIRKIAFVDKPLYNYRYQRKDSATVKYFQNSQIRFEQHVCVVETLFQALYQRELLERNGSFALKWALRFLYSDFVHLAAGSSKMDTSKVICEIFDKYRMFAYVSSLNPYERRRLNSLIGTTKECSQAKRFFDILYLKVENRILKKKVS